MKEEIEKELERKEEKGQKENKHSFHPAQRSLFEEEAEQENHRVIITLFALQETRP